MPEAGFEPAHSFRAPPPQDGVSAKFHHSGVEAYWLSGGVSVVSAASPSTASEVSWAGCSPAAG